MSDIAFLAIADIKAAVCAEWHVSPVQLMSHKRGRPIVRPRQAAMFLAYRHSRQSLPAIGRKFDRDHTTVLHAVRLVPQLVERDDTFAAHLAAVCVNLGVDSAAS